MGDHDGLESVITIGWNAQGMHGAAFAICGTIAMVKSPKARATKRFARMIHIPSIRCMIAGDVHAT